MLLWEEEKNNNPNKQLQRRHIDFMLWRNPESLSALSDVTSKSLRWIFDFAGQLLSHWR